MNRGAVAAGTDLTAAGLAVPADGRPAWARDVVDMNRRLGRDASLNTPLRDDGNSGEWQDWLADDSESQESITAESDELDNRRNALSKALTLLSERERRIFEARRLADNPMTLEELAEEFGVSRERIRQIEMHAFEKVQRAVQRRVMAISRSVSGQNIRHQPAQAA